MRFTILARAVGVGRVACPAAVLAIATLAAANAGPNAAPSTEPKATLELFTSQGCSSCPPADKLIGEFARDPSVVAMSLAIDYWDYLGWKDTLALKGHGNRQKAYARVRGDREVYTPQVVVNGIMHVNGGDRAGIERAIELTRREPTTMRVPLTVAVAGDIINIDVPAGKDGQGPGEIWVCPISKKVSVAIERGENRGQTLTYNNVVRRWVRIGEWSGKQESFQVPLKDLQNGGEVDSVAVMLQNGVAASPGAIMGAAIVQLP